MAEAPKPEFTHTFLVDSDNYGDFVRLVRQDVMKYCSQRPEVWQPVLPLEQKVPKQWFHVGLRNKITMKDPLMLAIRMDNLYLVGFRTPGPAGVWWEFDNDVEPGTHLITGARWLGFGGRYQDLVGQKGLETVPLGRASMALAVETLARHGTGRLEEVAGVDPHAVTKSMLVRLVIMICEGLRFLTVYGTVDKEFDSVDCRITELDGKQVNEWYKISKAVLTWAVNPAARFPDLEKIGIKDKNDAARVVALVKDVEL